MSSAISSTQIQPEFQGEDDGEEERDASPHSMLYIKLLRGDCPHILLLQAVIHWALNFVEIIQFARLEHPGLISPVDSQDLASFEAFSSTLNLRWTLPIADYNADDAQMFLTCLIMRKDLKWHPIRRVMKLGGRLDLDAKGIERVMTELCEVPCLSLDDHLPNNTRSSESPFCPGPAIDR